MVYEIVKSVGKSDTDGGTKMSYGIGDTVRFTDDEGIERTGVIRYAGYMDGRWIQDEYGRPGVVVEIPRGNATLHLFALASETTVVGGEQTLVGES